MISHENYIERIVDYYDGKLSQSESNALMAFLEINPDLYEEFLLFGEAMPETASEQPLKAPASLLEQLKNIPNESFVLTDELLVAYAEDDLDVASIKKVENAIAQNSDRQRDLKLMTAARFEPDFDIVFPFKNALRRKESVSFRSMFYYASAAIAAIFILAFFLWPDNGTQPGMQSGENTFAKLTLKKTISTGSSENEFIEYSIPANTFVETPQLVENHTTSKDGFENIALLSPRVAGPLKEKKIETENRIDDSRNEFLAIYDIVEFKNSLSDDDTHKSGTLTAWRDWGKGMFTGESSVKDTPADLTFRDVAEFSRTNINRLATENLSLSQKDK